MRNHIVSIIGLGALVLTTFAASGCSVTSVNPGGGGGGGNATDPGTPVKAQPLAGNIDGKPFTAKIAIATRGFNGDASKSVTIFSTDATCANQPQLADGAPQILVDVDSWADGSAFQLSFSTHTLTFLEQKNGGPDNLIVTTGRVEVTSAGTAAASGTAGTPGTIAIRGTDATFGSVEGQVPVLVCAQ